jgi:peptide/nickel transport system permease protein
MTNFLIRRVLQGLFVLFVSSVLVFLLLYLAPGGPLSQTIVEKRQNARYPIKQEDIDRLMKQYDLDLPLWQAYTRWAFGWPNLPDRAVRYGVIRGDFGTSWRIAPNEQTMQVILRVLPNTLYWLEYQLEFIRRFINIPKWITPSPPPLSSALPCRYSGLAQ